VGANLLLYLLFWGISPGRTFFKYLPDSKLALVALLVYNGWLLFLVFAFLRWREKLSDLLKNRLLYAGVLLVLLGVVLLGYPVADGLKVKGRGSDQDDCVILGVQHLLRLENPYLSLTYRGNPCSTGMGVLLPYIPLVALNLYEIGSVLFFSLTVWYLFNRYDPAVAGFFTLTFITNPLCMELMVVGSDLFLVGFFTLLAALYLDRHLERLNLRSILLSSLLVGLAASSRLPMLVLIGLFSIPVMLKTWQKGIWFLALCLILALGPSLLIYIQNPASFTPLHLINKARLFLSPAGKIVISALMLVFFLLALRLYLKNQNSLLNTVLWSLAPFFGGLWIGGLIYVEYDLVQLEHFNYLIPILPLVGAACLLELHSSSSTGRPLSSIFYRVRAKNT